LSWKFRNISYDQSCDKYVLSTTFEKHASERVGVEITPAKGDGDWEKFGPN
jgi:hypothetical protein